MMDTGNVLSAILLMAAPTQLAHVAWDLKVTEQQWWIQHYGTYRNIYNKHTHLNMQVDDASTMCVRIDQLQGVKFIGRPLSDDYLLLIRYMIFPS